MTDSEEVLAGPIVLIERIGTHSAPLQGSGVRVVSMADHAVEVEAKAKGQKV